MRLAGVERFLTQKLSWNLTNKWPHSTFRWYGLDNVDPVLVHFPPADTYVAKAGVDDLLKSYAAVRSKHLAPNMLTSGMLYGHGDGGGGPDERMLSHLDRLHQLARAKDGSGTELPVPVHMTPTELFDRIAADEAAGPALPVWRGELFFELHMGTFTTQAAVKRANRECEVLLREAELWAALAMRLGLSDYPQADLQAAWKLVLLNQFHDSVTGSCIEAVARGVRDRYAEAEKLTMHVMLVALQSLTQFVETEFDDGSFSVYESGDERGTKRQRLASTSSQESSLSSSSLASQSGPVDQARLAVCNTLPFPVSYVDRVADKQVMYKMPPFSISSAEQAVTKTSDVVTVSVAPDGTSLILENPYCIARLSQHGRLDSFVLKRSAADGKPREAILQGSEGGNNFLTFEDVPFFWENWDVLDYHENKVVPTPMGGTVSVDEDGPLKASVRVDHEISSAGSMLSQFISMPCDKPIIYFKTKVKWAEGEARNMLKVEFPLAVSTQTVQYEIQFGHLDRPTHRNTTWDAAKFEVCAHRWAHMGERGLGVALLNNGKYGHSVVDGNRLRLSLLRSGKHPDAHADVGQTHNFRYALYLHDAATPSDGGVVREAALLNSPLSFVQTTCGSFAPQSFLQVSTPAAVLETVKMAEDNGILLDSNDTPQTRGDLVFRVYEAGAGRVEDAVISWHARLGVARAVSVVDALEHDIPGGVEAAQVKLTPEATGVSFSLKPFEILTLRIKF